MKTTNSTCGGSAPAASSTRAVVESAIEAAKAGNTETWESVSECSPDTKWEEHEEGVQNREPAKLHRRRSISGGITET